MTTDKILQVVEMYEARLREMGIPKIRMDPKKTVRDLSLEELLAQAHFLCDGVRELARDPEKRRRTGSHLSAIQMCLSMAGWYTLEDLMNHNRPDGPFDI